MKRPKWFPWLELITILFCAPSLWLITHTFVSRAEIRPTILDRYLAGPVALFAAILSFYVVIRLGSITRWFALAYPVIWIVIYAALAGILMVIWRTS